MVQLVEARLTTKHQEVKDYRGYYSFQLDKIWTHPWEKPLGTLGMDFLDCVNRNENTHLTCRWYLLVGDQREGNPGEGVTAFCHFPLPLTGWANCSITTVTAANTLHRPQNSGSSAFQHELKTCGSPGIGQCQTGSAGVSNLIAWAAASFSASPGSTYPIISQSNKSPL